MDVQSLGAIGEFVSSIVIGITLIVLTIETRQAKKATLQANRESRQRIRHDLDRQRIETPSLNQIHVKAYRHLTRDKALDDELEAKQYGLLHEEFMQLRSNVLAHVSYWADQYYTDLPEFDRQRLNGQISASLQNPVFHKHWVDHAESYDPDFRSYIDNLIEQNQATV